MADGSVKIDITADSGKAEKELKEVESAAKEAGDGLEEMGDSAGEAEKGLDALDVAAGDFISGALQGLVQGIGNAVSQLFELADATREYREDMAKLETAFTTQGHTAEAAGEIYEDFYAILGESDRSVEAANHLAELTNNEQELAKWSDICAGVTAKFGDSLPIEGLTEAANETAKVGKVTGPLADALNWAGISEDAFNEKLAACNSEQKRAALITETLSGLYEDEAAKYNELTAGAQDARRATSEMEEAQAKAGAIIEPVTTAYTRFRATALETMIPVLQICVDGFNKLTAWAKENPGAMNVVKGVLLGVAVALGVLAAAFGIHTLIQTVTTAFKALNLAMLSNPIVLVVAAIAGLAAAFIYFWNTSEGFREFWTNLWAEIQIVAAPIIEDIKNAFSTAWEWIRGKWAEAQPFFAAVWAGIQEVFAVVKEWLPEIWNSAWAAIRAIWDNTKEYFSLIWLVITQIFSVAVVFFGGLFSSAWAAIKLVWDTVAGYFKAVWATIEGIFAVVEAVLSGDFRGAWEAIKEIVNTWKEYFAKVWDGIKEVFAAVKTWFGETFQGAFSAIKTIWDGVKGYFETVKKNILGVFDTIKSDFKGVGSNIIDGIWAGISAGWDWLTSKVASLASSLFEAAKEALDVNSPSRKFKWLGEMSAEGVSVGFDSVNLEDDIQKKLSGLTARAQMAVSADNARMAQGVGVTDTGFADLARAVGTQTAGINSLAGEYRRGAGNAKPVVLMLDGRELGRTVVDLGKAETVRAGLAY